jgi:hypothetical protein
MTQLVAAAARPLGGGSAAEALRSAAASLQPLARASWSRAARGRRESQVASVISRAPRAESEVLPVTPDDDAAVKVF